MAKKCLPEFFDSYSEIIFRTCYHTCLFAAKPRQNTTTTVKHDMMVPIFLPSCHSPSPLKLASTDATHAREEARNLRGGYRRAGRCRRRTRGRAYRQRTAGVAAARQRRRARTGQAAGRGSGRGMTARISAPHGRPLGGVAARTNGGGRGERRPAAGRPGRSAPRADALHGGPRGDVAADERRGEGERGPPPRTRP